MEQPGLLHLGVHLEWISSGTWRLSGRRIIYVVRVERPRQKEYEPELTIKWIVKRHIDSQIGIEWFTAMDALADGYQQAGSIAIS